MLDKHPQQWRTYPEVIDHLASHARGAPPLTETISFRAERSAPKTLALNSYPLFAPRDSGTILGTLVVVRDATGEALAKEKRAEFVAHVAHELKTPLNTLTLYSEMLMDNASDEELRTEAVNVIRDEVERIGALIGNLLNITRIEMGSLDLEKTRVRMHDFLKDVFEHLRHNVRGKNIEFELDLPRDLPPIRIDKDLLRVAINNLLTNAIKYNRDGGKVRLSAAETDEAITIEVEDTGLGIAPEDQQRVFGRFVRGKSAQVAQQGGHGLGLALAKDIVELHEGHLSFRSEPNQGSTFTIALRKGTGPVAAGDLTMKHILIVDDEPTVIRVLRLALERAGYSVTKANNGEEALDRLRERVPDAMITDIEMPYLDGEGLCRQIEVELPDRQFPIFVVTSLTAVEHRRWSESISNLHFLEKPISARRLIGSLAAYFDDPQQRAARA